MATQNFDLMPTPSDETTKYEPHRDKLEHARAKRKLDKTDKTKAAICFDLQNVITCPRASTSNFYYKRKFNVYNLTLHFSFNNRKKVFLYFMDRDAG